MDLLNKIMILQNLVLRIMNRHLVFKAKVGIKVKVVLKMFNANFVRTMDMLFLIFTSYKTYFLASPTINQATTNLF